MHSSVMTVAMISPLDPPRPLRGERMVTPGGRCG
jgi:hypothetical protein